MVGSYAINNVLYDLVTCVIFGFVGYLMIRYGFPWPHGVGPDPGGMMESNCRRALSCRREIPPSSSPAITW